MKLKASKYDIAANLLCLLMLLGITVYLIISWSSIPDKIPGHYNAAGEVDRWGDKSELLFLPVLGWLLYIGITLLERFPQVWNTGVTVTVENKERVYRILKNMIGTLKIMTVAIFTSLTINTAFAKALPVFFLPLILLLMFGFIIFFMIRLNRSK